MAVTTLGNNLNSTTVLQPSITPVTSSPMRTATQSGTSWSIGEVDPVFTAWDKSTGINIDSDQITGVNVGDQVVALDDWSIEEENNDLVIKYNDETKALISNDTECGIIFDTCLVRNAEMDNTISNDIATPLTISAKNGQVLTINDLPNYNRFDEPGWVVVEVETFSDRQSCIIDRTLKTLTFAASVNLSAWLVGFKIVLYNPFINYKFVGDQTINPIVSTVGAPSWRAGVGTNGSFNGPMFRHSDGRFICLFLGYEDDGGTRGRLGYVYSNNMTTWTIGNSDNYVLNYTDIPDCASIQIGGSATEYAPGQYWSVICYGRISDGHGEVRILYYDEDLTTFTYSDPIVADLGLGYVGCSIIPIGSYYHLILNYLHPFGVAHRVLQAFKSASLEGPYIKYQDIVTSVKTTNPDVPWADHVDPGVFFNDGIKIFGLFGAYPYTMASGIYANRVYSLLDFDTVTETWSVNQKGIGIMCPQDYSYIPEYSGLYNWCDDHCGGHPSIFIDGQDAYMTLTMKGSQYQMALIKLNYYSGSDKNHVPYEGATKNLDLGNFDIIAHNINGSVSGTNTGDQNLSVLVPYTGAVSDVDITGQKLITDSVTINDVPVNLTDAATKEYVDSVAASGIMWQEAVIDILTPLPGGASVGDRYIDTSDDSINEWNGASWDTTAAVPGFITLVTTGPTVAVGWYSYNGSNWIYINNAFAHNDTTGKQGGQAGQYYHLNAAEHSIATTPAATAQDGYLSGTDWDTFNDKQAALTFGIANTNTVIINSADVEDNDYAKFTATGLEGRNYTDLRSDIGLTWGISDGNTVKIDDPSAAATEYARFTTTGVMGVTPIDVKTDIGLGSVEDTALSSWPGSANLVQLGDVTTGSWKAATVAVAYGGTGTTTSTGTGSTVLSTSPTLTSATLTTSTINTSLTIQNDAWVGQSAGPKLTFDDSNNYLEVTGCSVGIGTTAPLHELDVRGTIVCDGDIIAYHS